MVKPVRVKRRMEAYITGCINCGNDFLRGAEICVGLIACGKCRNYDFVGWPHRRVPPPETGMIRSVGTIKYNLYRF
jgi:hypothetical protein